MSAESQRFDEQMIAKAVELAIANVDKGGEPFGTAPLQRTGTACPLPLIGSAIVQGFSR